MARSQNLKRQREGDLSQGERSAKRIRSAREHHKSNFSPEFWDNLSKVWLTRRALRELDRRNSIQPPPEPTFSRLQSTNLARFARRGGPDLFDIRGYPEPKHAARTMSSNRTSGSSSRRTQSTKGTSVTGGRRSSAYDDDFEQHLIDYNIYPTLYDFPDNRPTPKPVGLNEVRQEWSANRPSLSPSRFTESAFENLRRKNKTKSEGSVMRNVIPIIAGNTDIPNEGHLPFTNFDSITEGATVKAVPDFFDGARWGDVDMKVRDDLSGKIIPTKHTDVPVVPNFFLEAKAPRGGADVAQRQACYDGALGARAMHSLQNYGRAEPVYDGKILAVSSTYHNGQLQIYGHHVSAPTAPGGKPEYHMNQVKAYAITSDLDACVDGLKGFRNSRDWAQKKRDSFIEAANARARAGTAPGQEYTVTDATEVQLEGNTTSAYYDLSTGLGTAESSTQVSTSTSSAQQMPSATTGWTWSNNRNNWYHRREDGSREWYQGGNATLVDPAEDEAEFQPAPPSYLYTEDDSQASSQAYGALDFVEPPTSFASSFTSSFTTDQTGYKRPRQSSSPPSSSRENHAAKSRSRRGATRQATELSTQATASGQADITESYWVETYRRKGKVYFKNLDNQEVKTKSNDWTESTLDDGTLCYYWQSPRSGRTFWTRGTW